MSDKDKLVALLESFGIIPTPNNQYGDPFEPVIEGGQVVALLAHEGNMNGYGGFFCAFHFDEQGKFVCSGIWE